MDQRIFAHLPTGGAGAHDSLATVLGYVGADIVNPACRRAACP